MEYGYIRVKVEEMRLKKGISKNKLCHAAELERKQLNAYCREDIALVNKNWTQILNITSV